MSWSAVFLAQGNLAEACDCIELQPPLVVAQWGSVCGISKTSLSWGLLDFYLKLCGLESCRPRHGRSQNQFCRLLNRCNSHHLQWKLQFCSGRWNWIHMYYRQKTHHWLASSGPFSKVSARYFPSVCDQCFTRSTLDWRCQCLPPPCFTIKNWSVREGGEQSLLPIVSFLCTWFLSGLACDIFHSVKAWIFFCWTILSTKTIEINSSWQITLSPQATFSPTSSIFYFRREQQCYQSCLTGIEQQRWCCPLCPPVILLVEGLFKLFLV